MSTAVTVNPRSARNTALRPSPQPDMGPFHGQASDLIAQEVIRRRPVTKSSPWYRASQLGCPTVPHHLRPSVRSLPGQQRYREFRPFTAQPTPARANPPPDSLTAGTPGSSGLARCFRFPGAEAEWALGCPGADRLVEGDLDERKDKRDWHGSCSRPCRLATAAHVHTPLDHARVAALMARSGNGTPRPPRFGRSRRPVQQRRCRWV